VSDFAEPILSTAHERRALTFWPEDIGQRVGDHGVKHQNGEFEVLTPQAATELPCFDWMRTW
jgi:hypothetical protein